MHSPTTANANVRRAAAANLVAARARQDHAIAATARGRAVDITSLSRQDSAKRSRRGYLVATRRGGLAS